MTMNSYIEIEILPGELNVNHIMSSLFSHLHLLLAQNQRIGLGWPKMDITPGNIIRLFGSREDLLVLDVSGLARYSDYARISGITPVPESCGYARYRRVQVWGKRRGQMKLSLPFIRVKSFSNGNRFRLFIEKTQVNEFETGNFNGYGLNGMVPEF